MTTKETQRLEEQAIIHLRGGYHCSEAVLKTLTDHYGIDNDLLLRVSNPFGGGIGDSDNLCGAAAGAVMVIGAILTPKTKTEGSWPAGAAAKMFMKRFEEEIGTTNCKEIRRGLHWSKSKEYCDAAVKAATRIGLEVIDAHLKKNKA